MGCTRCSVFRFFDFSDSSPANVAAHLRHARVTIHRARGARASGPRCRQVQRLVIQPVEHGLLTDDTLESAATFELPQAARDAMTHPTPLPQQPRVTPDRARPVPPRSRARRIARPQCREPCQRAPRPPYYSMARISDRSEALGGSRRPERSPTPGPVFVFQIRVLMLDNVPR